MTLRPFPVPLAQCLASLALMIGLAGSAAAQSIPDDIPGGPRSVPEQQREQLTERHRDVISRFFTGADVSVAPAFDPGLAVYSAELALGFAVQRHDALALTMGARQYVVEDPEASAWLRGRKETAALFAVRYDLGLARFMEASSFSRRAAIGIGMGTVMSGRFGLLTVEVAPTYVLPIDRRWHLPLGLKVGQAILGGRAARVRTTFVGLSIGVKRFYGHRDHLK